MRAKLELERAGKLLTKVAAVFYDLVPAHICSGVLAKFGVSADRQARGRPPR
jgi:hypothetical protein